MLPNKKFLNECGVKKCKNPLHGNQIISVISNLNHSDERVAAFLVKTCKHFASVVDSSHKSALQQAAIVGRYQLVEWLIKNGADVNFKTPIINQTALHYAIKYGNINIAVLLQMYEGSLEILDNRRRFPLKYLIPFKQKRKQHLWPFNQYVSEDEDDDDDDDLDDRLERLERLQRYFNNPSEPQRSLWYNNDDEKPADKKVNNNLSEILVWGCNKNYNLGICMESSESIPQHLDYFQKNDILIIDISMSMYHTMFLDRNGNIYTVGHGKGGRLGISVENSLVEPDEVKLFFPNHFNFPHQYNSNKVKSINAGKYHSIILTEHDMVYVTGLNTYFQLGIKNPAPEKLLKFKRVFIERQDSPNNSNPFINVIARDYHSMVYSKNEIYGWGLNGGQFGFNNSVDTTVPTKIFTFGLNLTLVASSNAAIACYAPSSQVILLYNKYTISRIHTPTSQSINILAIKGGDFTPNYNLTLSKQENIAFIVVTSDYKLFIWYEDIHKYVRYDNSHKYKISSLKWFNQSILMLSRGYIYIGHIKRTTKKCGAGNNNNKIMMRSNDHAHDDGYYENTYIKREIANNEQIDLNIRRIPLVDRVQMVTCDPECKSFICSQLHSRHHLEIPKLNMKEFNFKSLLVEAAECDGMHDIVFHIEDEKFFAHKFIVFSRSPKLQNIVNQFTDKHVYLKYENFTSKMFDLILKYIYTNHLLTIEDLEDNEFSVIFLEYKEKFGFDKNDDSINLLPKAKKSSKCQNVIPPLNRNEFPELYDVKIICTGGIEIKAHKCVLVTRLKYFRMMFQNVWPEKSIVNFPTVAIEYMTTILDFIYTNDMDYIRSHKFSEKYIYNMLIICDQFIIDQLGEIFEILLIEKMTIKKCTEMLEFALIYNCKHLEKAALNFICFNMGRILDARALEHLSDTIYLTKITEFYKKNILPKKRHYLKGIDHDDYNVNINVDDILINEINLDSINIDLTRKYFDNDKIQKKNNIIAIDQMQQERLNCERDGKESLLMNVLKEKEIEEKQQQQQQQQQQLSPNASSSIVSINSFKSVASTTLGTKPKLKLETKPATININNKWTKVEDKKELITKQKNKTTSLLAAGLHSNEILKNENVQQNEFVNLNNFNKFDSNQSSTSKLSVIGSGGGGGDPGDESINAIPIESGSTNEITNLPSASTINLGTFILHTKNSERLSQKQRKRYLSESATTTATTHHKSIHSGKTNIDDDDNVDADDDDADKLSKSLSSTLLPMKISNESFANVMKCENNKNLSIHEDVQESPCSSVNILNKTPIQIKFINRPDTTAIVASTSAAASAAAASSLSPPSPSSSSPSPSSSPFPKLSSKLELIKSGAAIKHKNSKPTEFTEILKDERKQRDYFEKSTKKSLRLTQMEETAIVELSRFYNIDNVYDERIQIDRRPKYINPTLNFASWQKQ